MKIKELANGGIFSDGDWVESKDQDPEGKVRLIQLADIGDGIFIDKSNRFMNKETADRLRCTFLKKGDILIARMPDPIGRACLFPLEEENKFVSVVDVGILRLKETHSAKYVMYGINSPLVRRQIESQVTGTTRQRITRKKIGEIDLPLPPLDQQKKIATILDAADAYRQKTKALIEKYDELTQSLFLDMFGDPVTNPKGWEKIPLGKLSERIVVGHVGPTSDGYTEFGIPFLRTQNVRPNFINYNDLAQITSEFHNKLKKSQIFAKDILISRVGVNRGMAAVVPDDLNEANCANVVIVGNTKFLNSYYLSFFLNKSFGTKPEYGYSVGSAQGVVNTSIVKKWPVFNASLELQNQFAERVQAIEEQKAQAQESLDKAEDLFNCLLQKAFKGELTL